MLNKTDTGTVNGNVFLVGAVCVFIGALVQWSFGIAIITFGILVIAGSIFAAFSNGDNKQEKPDGLEYRKAITTLAEQVAVMVKEDGGRYTGIVRRTGTP